MKNTHIDKWKWLKTMWLLVGIVALAVACRQPADPIAEQGTVSSQVIQTGTARSALKQVTALPTATQQVSADTSAELSADVSTPLLTAEVPTVSLAEQETLTVVPTTTPTVPETTSPPTMTPEVTLVTNPTATSASTSATATNTAVPTKRPTNTPLPSTAVPPTPSRTPLPTLTSTTAPTSTETPPQAQHFSGCATRTGNNATLLLPVEAAIVGDLTLDHGDEIAVFAPDSVICAGMTTWQGENVALSAWGDDTQTESIDGLLAGEELVIRIWDISAAVEYVVVDAQFSLGDGIYNTDSFHVVSSLTVTPP